MILEEHYVRFLIQNNLTQAQYLLLHLVYKKKPELIKLYKDAFPTHEEGNTSMIGNYLTKDLFNRGFLEEIKGKVTLTKKFLCIFVDKHKACDEIFEIYPTFFEKDGNNIPLSAMDRNVFTELYDKAINSSVEEHLEVVEDILFAIDQKLLPIGIDKFVKSKYWLTIRPRRLAGIVRTETITIRDNEFNS